MIDQINDLITTINNSSIKPAGIKNSLIVKLRAALRAVQAGKNATACSALRAFTNEVNAQEGKKIPVDLATTLSFDAAKIMAEICFP